MLRTGVPAHRRGLFLALFVAAFALRPLVVGIGPLLSDIQVDLRLSNTMSGLLTTIPVLAMGLLAPIGQRVAGRLGGPPALLASLVLIGCAGLLRSLVPDATLLLVLTLAIGLGMAVGSVVQPILVKARAADISTSATGIYALGVIVGSAAAAAVAVPLADVTGGWRGATAVMALAVLAAAVVVAVILGAGSDGADRPGARARLPWRERTAWLIAVIFGLQALVYWALVTWLPSVLEGLRWTAADAGVGVAVFQSTGIVAVLAVPLLGQRLVSGRGALILTAALIAGSLVGLVLAPDVAMLWVVIAGAALGAVFPLVLDLPVAHGRDPVESGGLGAMMLLVGYTIAAAGPLLFGVVRDATDGGTATVLVLAAVATAFGALCARLAPRPSAPRQTAT